MRKSLTAMSCVEIDVEIKRLNELLTFVRDMSKNGDPAAKWSQVAELILDALERADKEKQKRC